ncbi:hypothetical protein [Actinoallomurus sp. NPDC050550]|uniref:PP2C family protein-serine/threonine phosphatase n=1 Tax=Actinoallomurus sp. NPDC050550 TaxID=3154937 RepID=UPI0033C7B1D5
MWFSFAAGSVSGSKASTNRDAVYAAPTVLAVAEGLGEGGELSGKVAVDAARCFAAAGTSRNADEAALAIFQRAHRGLKALAAEQGHAMQASMTALVLAHGHLGLAHIGNTLAFMVRDGVMFQIAVGDRRCVLGMPFEMIDAPFMPCRSLYTEMDPDPAVSLRNVRAGDRYMVCSDGLGMPLSPETLHTVLSQERSPETAVASLLALEPLSRHRDNATCIVADVAVTDQDHSLAVWPRHLS